MRPRYERRERNFPRNELTVEYHNMFTQKYSIILHYTAPLAVPRSALRNNAIDCMFLSVCDHAPLPPHPKSRLTIYERLLEQQERFIRDMTATMEIERVISMAIVCIDLQLRTTVECTTCEVVERLHRVGRLRRLTNLGAIDPARSCRALLCTPHVCR